MICQGRVSAIANKPHSEVASRINVRFSSEKVVILREREKSTPLGMRVALLPAATILPVYGRPYTDARWPFFFEPVSGRGMRLTDRWVGFNVMEWGFILLMGRLAFYNVGFTIPYGSTESDFMTEVAVPLTFTVLLGVLPVFLLRGAVGAFRKLRS